MIKPYINYRMKNIDFSYDSINGKFKINWKWVNTIFYMNVSIPYGVEAKIILPNEKSFNVTGGEYHFECDINKKIYSPFSIDTPLVDIIKNNESIKIIKDLLPKIHEKILEKNNKIFKNTIREIYSEPIFNYSNIIISKCNEKLSNIKP